MAHFRSGCKFLEFGLTIGDLLLGLALLLRQGVGSSDDLSSGGGDYTSLLWYEFVQPQYDKKEKLIEEGMDYKDARKQVDMTIKGNAPKELWEYLGRWVGDSIAIVGDYDETEWKKEYDDNSYKDIGGHVAKMVQYAQKAHGIESKPSFLPDMVLTG